MFDHPLVFDHPDTCGDRRHEVGPDALYAEAKFKPGALARRYVPNRQLAFEYPDAYPEAEASIADDANILARPEREPPAAPPASLSLRERFERE